MKCYIYRGTCCYWVKLRRYIGYSEHVRCFDYFLIESHFQRYKLEDSNVKNQEYWVPIFS